jgi:hypothetical protein
MQEYSISPEIPLQAPSCLLVLFRTPPVLHQIQEKSPITKARKDESTKEDGG